MNSEEDGFCECGCEMRTKIRRGKPNRYLLGHSLRLRQGQKSAAWKGGMTIDSGRVLIWMPDHPHATQTGYVRRSILVAEKELGRFLVAGEIVHHKNRDTMDDTPDNLLVMTRAAHAILHRREDGTGMNTNPKKGTDHWDAKLTESDVLQIRQLALAGHRNVALAADFGVSRQQIRNIVTRTSWRHI